MKEVLSVRVDPDLKERLEKVTDPAKAYAPSKSQVVERGLELALRELEKRS